MSFAHGETVYRDRRKPIPDRFNPDTPTIPGWADVDADPQLADTVPLAGVYVAASSTSAVPEATRTQSLDYQSLYATDRNVDVRINDRIRVGADEDGVGGTSYYVTRRPQGDRNPFTGWEPGVEIPLVSVIG